MSPWKRQQLTFGGEQNWSHAHSYYDIPVFDAASTRIAAIRHNHAANHHPGPEDAVEIGLVEADRPGSWHAVGRSTAWSWQQGPMAQWVPPAAGTGERLVWNDREDGRFVAHLADPGVGGSARTLPMPVYAVMPDGQSGLSVNMGRLQSLRPGYGYAVKDAAPLTERRPEEDGIWQVPFTGDTPRLLLPLDQAVAFLLSQLPRTDRLRHAVTPYFYWFNHVKIAPGGRRFTVKLRWRRRGGPWSGRMGVSLTCDTQDGTDLRLLGRATSHVVWLDDHRLYYFDERRREMLLLRDAAHGGERLGPIGGGLSENVHLRHLPPAPPASDGLPPQIVYDTPYREAPELWISGPKGEDHTRIAVFSGHVPAKGPFRCDLHPVPDASGDRIVVTSAEGGQRQIHLIERER
ncbi:hypothetical protein OCH239_15650 [Roseivivax halodurans JCM 10272]|uniref:Uncharacterized protein n=1 Tax=Roseivivax halodurans JCM 10272 TaxID=1449350 RepID=X7ECL9_9RHOB|nr:hypothetical protein [Roseivivax halodurans]ETX12858.1 hypothetical protein OCH239_15650 [Roseivivax halodurans JCM 10272]